MSFQKKIESAKIGKIFVTLCLEGGEFSGGVTVDDTSETVVDWTAAEVTQAKGLLKKFAKRAAIALEKTEPDYEKADVSI